jgi:hypothetical protein
VHDGAHELIVRLSHALFTLSLLGCPGKAVVAAPPVESLEPAMPDPSHVAVTLNLPYHPWQADYDRVSGDPDLAPHLAAMRAALEAPGVPEERLRALGTATIAARTAIASRGPGPAVASLERVEFDLRLAFFRDLSIAVAAQPAPREDRLSALRALEALVSARVGVPAPQPTRAWTSLGRMAAETDVQVQIEALTAEN